MVRAARLTGHITVDGRLDEPAWAAAEPATTFTQFDPAEGQPATKPTSVRILIGDDALYIGARMTDDPANIRARLARRDDPVDGDVFAVSIDSRHDHLSAYYFRVTAGGAVRDAVETSQGGGRSLDLSWDAVWDARVSRDDTGWTAELRIPLSQLFYSQTNDPVWGIQLERYSWNKQEQDFFAFTPKSEPGGVSRFAHLQLQGQLPAPSRIELMPYVTTRADFKATERDDPFHTGHDVLLGAGADLRYRLTSTTTLTATFNPDFGQVEVDPAVVNLSAFETFFPEKRPFFVAGREQFAYGQFRTFNSYGFPSMFFSRRIGRQPQRGIFPGQTIDGVRAEFVDAPEQTTIYGAGKLTGKSRGWSFAALEAVTAEETAEIADDTGARASAIVEPVTNYFIGRVRREVGAGSTQLGGFLSSVIRDLGDSTLASSLRHTATVAGVDFNHAWSGQSWVLDANLATSLVNGTDSAIARTQRNSTHYLQRPDFQNESYDPTRTSLSGLAGEIAVTRRSAKHWVGNLAYQDVTPRFESNDVGFQRQAGRRAVSTDLAYLENKPGRYFRSWNWAGFTNTAWNYDGDPVFDNYASAIGLGFNNFSFFNIRGDLSQPSVDDAITRGGPRLLRPAQQSMNIAYSFDRRKRYLATLFGDARRLAKGEKSIDYGADVTWQVSPTFNIALSPFFAFSHSLSELVARFPGGPPETFGTGYVFGMADQKQLAVQTRVNWTFTPTLSLQLFAQPLAAKGTYSDFRVLRRQHSYEFDPYAGQAGPIDPDYRVLSLRGDGVLRWEYRPGATLYFVWQQGRNGFDPSGADIKASRDVRDIFGLPPRNVFAIKGTYWFSR